jgi:hypothetical protein
MEESPEMKEQKREERRDQTMNNTHGGTREMINPAEAGQRS